MNDPQYTQQYEATADEVCALFTTTYNQENKELTLADLKPLFIERFGSLEAVPAGVREGVTAGIFRARTELELN